ncbi:MAG: hypothetical protein IJ676_04660 [Clostridia bacterium]|nr:hypothetical protein [Clostridia bacterium]
MDKNLIRISAGVENFFDKITLDNILCNQSIQNPYRFGFDLRKVNLFFIGYDQFVFKKNRRGIRI